MKFSTYSIGLLMAVCFSWVAVQAYARKEITKPCFVTTNTRSLEVTKITLTDEYTRLDAVMYGTPGDYATISDKTFLWAAGQRFPLREAEHVSIGGLTEPESMPENGRLHVCLLFAPLPADVHAVDFVDREDGWHIQGLQLTGIEPYVFVPDFLQNIPAKKPTPLQEPALNPGKGIINGYILGYDEGTEVNASLKVADWLTYSGTILPVRIRKDGSFHVECDLLMATCVRLQLNGASLDFLLLPGKELTIHIHLPRFSMAASHLFEGKYKSEQYVWFDGAYTPERCDYTRYRRELEEKTGEKADLWQDVHKARTAYLSLADSQAPDAANKTALSEISSDIIRSYVEKRVEASAEEAQQAKAVNGYVIAEIDTTLTGSSILPTLLAPYRGHAVLLDLWATWCAPCLRSMRILSALKPRLTEMGIVYMYATGPSSPEHVWASMLPGIKGIHYRLTAAQWKSLCDENQVTGIPAYLIFDAEGRLCKKFIGFPGADALSEELCRASKCQ